MESKGACESLVRQSVKDDDDGCHSLMTIRSGERTPLGVADAGAMVLRV